MKKVGYLFVLAKNPLLEDEKVDFLEAFEEKNEEGFEKIEVVFIYTTEDEEVKSILWNKYKQCCQDNKEYLPAGDEKDKLEKTIRESEFLLPYLEKEDCYSVLPEFVLNWADDKVDDAKLLFLEIQKED